MEDWDGSTFRGGESSSNSEGRLSSGVSQSLERKRAKYTGIMEVPRAGQTIFRGNRIIKAPLFGNNSSICRIPRRPCVPTSNRLRKRQMPQRKGHRNRNIGNKGNSSDEMCNRTPRRKSRFHFAPCAIIDTQSSHTPFVNDKCITISSGRDVNNSTNRNRHRISPRGQKIIGSTFSVSCQQGSS